MSRDSKKEFKCVVRMLGLLHDASESFILPVGTTGDDLLRRIGERLNIGPEITYFGMWVPNSSPKKWITGGDNLVKQLAKNVLALGATLMFGVKYFVSNPNKLVSEQTRYYFFLQVRDDMSSGQFQVNDKRSALRLCAFIAQAELGDFNPTTHVRGYIAELLMMPDQTFEDEAEISRLHAEHTGMATNEAEFQMLQLAALQRMYGYEFFRAVDSKKREINFGIGETGISSFGPNNIRLEQATWSEIVTVTYKGKTIGVETKSNPADPAISHKLVFKVSSSKIAEALWKCAIQRHTFFRRRKVPSVKKSSALKKALRMAKESPIQRAHGGSGGKTQHEVIRESVKYKSSSPMPANFRRNVSVSSNRNTPQPMTPQLNQSTAPTPLQQQQQQQQQHAPQPPQNDQTPQHPQQDQQQQDQFETPKAQTMDAFEAWDDTITDAGTLDAAKMTDVGTDLREDLPPLPGEDDSMATKSLPSSHNVSPDRPPPQHQQQARTQHVRALFNSKHIVDSGGNAPQLRFNVGDILSIPVQDEDNSWWNAEDVATNAVGRIPSPLTCSLSSHVAVQKGYQPVVRFEPSSQRTRPVCLLGHLNEGVVNEVITQFPDKFRDPLRHTSRPPLDGEDPELDYNFVTEAQLAELTANGFFCESNELGGASYSLSYNAIVSATSGGDTCIVDVSNAESVFKLMTVGLEPITMLVLPSAAEPNSDFRRQQRDALKKPKSKKARPLSMQEELMKKAASRGASRFDAQGNLIPSEEASQSKVKEMLKRGGDDVDVEPVHLDPDTVAQVAEADALLEMLGNVPAVVCYGDDAATICKDVLSNIEDSLSRPFWSVESVREFDAIESGVKTVLLKRGPRGYGFTVSSIGHTIASVTVGGVAEASGKINQGDRIVAVNSNPTAGLEFKQLMGLMKGVLQLELQLREPEKELDELPPIPGLPQTSPTKATEDLPDLPGLPPTVKMESPTAARRKAPPPPQSRKGVPSTLGSSPQTTPRTTATAPTIATTTTTAAPTSVTEDLPPPPPVASLPPIALAPAKPPQKKPPAPTIPIAITPTPRQQPSVVPPPAPLTMVLKRDEEDETTNNNNESTTDDVEEENLGTAWSRRRETARSVDTQGALAKARAGALKAAQQLEAVADASRATSPLRADPLAEKPPPIVEEDNNNKQEATDNAEDTNTNANTDATTDTTTTANTNSPARTVSKKMTAAERRERDQKRKAEWAALVGAYHGVLTETKEISFSRKLGESLGFTIAGGSDQNLVPGDSGSYIISVADDGVAAKDGRLRVGDRVLEANGVTFNDVAHPTVVRVLKSDKENVRLKICRPTTTKLGAHPPKKSDSIRSKQQAKESSIAHLYDGALTVEVVVELVKTRDQSFGFSFNGGTEKPVHVGDTAIYLSSMVEGGIAASCGQLKIGDRILEANGTKLHDVTRVAVLNILKSNPTKTLLKLCRPADDKEIEIPVVANEVIEDEPKEAPPQTIRDSAREYIDVHLSKNFVQDTFGFGVRPGDNNTQTVGRVFPGSISVGKLRTGDVLEEINGQMIASLDHDGLISIIKQSEALHLLVSRAKITIEPTQGAEQEQNAFALPSSISIPLPLLPTTKTPLPPPPTTTTPPQPVSETTSPTPTPTVVPAPRPTPTTTAPTPPTPTPPTPTLTPTPTVTIPTQPLVNAPPLRAPPPPPNAAVSTTTPPTTTATATITTPTPPPTPPTATPTTPTIPTPNPIASQPSLVTKGDFYEIAEVFDGFEDEAHCIDALRPENLARNRYTDIIPYDHTRVKLSGDNDYINANTIIFSDVGVDLDYIACQGPLETTTNDFWQLVWEQGVSVICMMTGLVENCRVKCEQYWPEEGVTTEYGYVTVETISETDKGGYTIRKFVVRETFGNNVREVHQCHFGAWPDHGVPEEPSDFVRFLTEVESLKSAASPMLLHCSAGIGRTGVFMLTETALALMQKGHVADLDMIVTKFREQRMHIVQTEMQFEFAYDTLRGLEIGAGGGPLAPKILETDLREWAPVEVPKVRVVSPETPSQEPLTKKAQVYEFLKQYDGSLTKVIEISYDRDDSGLGFRFGGGVDAKLREGDDNIYISAITKGGAAEKDGRLRIGDRILEANGTTFNGVTHSTVKAVLTTNTSGVHLLVCRPTTTTDGSDTGKQPAENKGRKKASDGNLKRIVESFHGQLTDILGISFPRKVSEPLGFSFGGGIDQPMPNGDTNIYVTNIVSNRAADRDGKLKVGDRILEINGTVMHSVKHQTVVKALNSDKQFVMLKVCRPLGSPTTTLTSSSPSPTSPTLSPSPSPMSPSPSHTKSNNNNNNVVAPVKDTEESTSNRFSGTFMAPAQVHSPEDARLIELVTKFNSLFTALEPIEFGREVGQSLGFKFGGGVEKPIVADDTHIYVTEVIPGGVAEQHGALKVGDRIIEANGVEFQDMIQPDVARVLKSNKTFVRLKVCRPDLDQATGMTMSKMLETIELPKKGPLGFTLSGGADEPNPSGDTSIYVKNIFPGGVAASDGRLRPSDKVISVNGTPLFNVTHDHAVRVLQSDSTSVALGIERQFNRIRVQSDAGTYGIFFSGGADSGTPVTISQVAHNSAAEKCGVVAGMSLAYINCLNVAKMTHDQVMDIVASSPDVLELMVTAVTSPKKKRKSKVQYL